MWIANSPDEECHVQPVTCSKALGSSKGSVSPKRTVTGDYVCKKETEEELWNLSLTFQNSYLHTSQHLPHVSGIQITRRGGWWGESSPNMDHTLG